MPRARLAIRVLRALKALARRHTWLRRLAHKHSALASRWTLLMTRTIEDPIERAGVSGFFTAEDLDEVTRVVFDEGHASPRYQHLAHAHMTLPAWFCHDLDPFGLPYAQQQQRLWRLIAGVDRDYEPDVDEKEAPLGEVDAVRFPGHYLRRDPGAVVAASDHIIASGMILKHSGLEPGDWALEYGAGFGQTALSLARLGVNVDTVDISRAFCQYVQQQADHFQVPLRAHLGRFGTHPRPGHRYDLIFFYESFHHCLDWQGLLRALPQMLAPGGRVLLCGEPMVERQYAAVPYPWGLRLHSDVVATIRRWHWFELGFSEHFLHEIFAQAGFTIRRHQCEPSLWGRTYVCERWPDELRLAQAWLPPVMEDHWHAPEAEGRRPRRDAYLVLPGGPAAAAQLEIDIANVSATPLTVELSTEDWRQRTQLSPGKRCTVRFTPGASRRLVFRTEPSPSEVLRRAFRLGKGEPANGVVVHCLRRIGG
jgi:2-polyprenyl-3-methyl-5-hydroxy-6-metoxy-1,4-benzoquinol methylase